MMQIINNTCNGKCSNCGECCSDVLPLSEKEINNIRKYIKQHNIQEMRHLSVLDTRLDLTCPFRDNENKKCVIYEVRPDICKCFICCKTIPNIEHDKALLHSTRIPYSMRNIFFNGKPLEEICATIIKKLGG